MTDNNDTRPPAVRKAMSLLAESDTLEDPELRARQLHLPIITLRDYVKENPGSEHRELRSDVVSSRSKLNDRA
jgi:hypothetical protein